MSVVSKLWLKLTGKTLTASTQQIIIAIALGQRPGDAAQRELLGALASRLVPKVEAILNDIETNTKKAKAGLVNLQIELEYWKAGGG